MRLETHMFKMDQYSCPFRVGHVGWGCMIAEMQVQWNFTKSKRKTKKDSTVHYHRQFVHTPVRTDRFRTRTNRSRVLS